MSETGTPTVRQRVLDYLRDHHTMTLATIGPDGPWATGLFYAHDEFDVYWLSDPRSRHSRNIAVNPQVAVAIHEDYRRWEEIRGIQMEGVAELVGPLADAGRPADIYLTRYPFLRDPAHLPRPLAEALTRARLYHFMPRRIYFIDNSQGFASRQEVMLPSMDAGR
ncbi:MAG: pyridoxamine 5'-phosphate oxidase [Acidobacteria bacterium]|nr:MAG: pyridoxamine 5'-phosphate oxidase [Acidobacteriota bacterium]